MSRRPEAVQVWAATSEQPPMAAGIELYDVTVTITVPAESIAEAVAAVVAAVGDLA